MQLKKGLVNYDIGVELKARQIYEYENTNP